MKHEKTIKCMTLEQKCAMLSGADVFRTYALAGVPSIWLSDGPHGLRKQAGESDHLGLNPSEKATCFPTATTVANSWDTALGEMVGKAVGEEAVDQQVSVVLGPGLNMKRDPRCGRNFEYFSEDPYLAGKMAAAYVRGIQGEGVSACPKHFAVNNQELRRMATDSVVDERTLREIYLTGFEIAVKESAPKCIMTSYNKVNGVYANESEHLLMDVLRKAWGYQGMVVTDWGGSNDHALGVKVGSTLEMPAPGLDAARELLAAIKGGRITEQDVDARLNELLTLIDETQSAVTSGKKADMDAHHDLARRVAAESIVLLKNENGLLPLQKGTKVALIGDMAFTPRYQGAGSSVVNATKVECLAEEIAHTGLDCVAAARGYHRNGEADAALIAEAADAARKADVALLCLGLTELDESEGIDRAHMRLAQNQIDLLEAIRQTGVKVVVLFHAGSAVEMPWLHHADALLHAALGGQAGASALLGAVTGETNPSGKLAETWPIALEDAPSIHHFGGDGSRVEYREGPFIGYRYYQTAGKNVRFPFGYGLSYTTFAYENLTADESGVTLTVRNTGSVAGSEVVQVYISKVESEMIRPQQELKGFAKVRLMPGEAKQVRIPLDDKAFRYWNVKSSAWEIEGGEYEVRVGASCEDIRLTALLSIKGTGAPVPYGRDELPHYFTGEAQNVPAAEFEKLLGHQLPPDRPVIDRNMTLGQIHHSRAPLGWLIGWVLNYLLESSKRKGTTDLNLLFVHNMPLRAIAKMTNGMVSMGMVDGLVMELKGFWVIGLCKTLYEFVKNLILNAQMKKSILGK